MMRLNDTEKALLTMARSLDGTTLAVDEAEQKAADRLALANLVTIRIVGTLKRLTLTPEGVAQAKRVKRNKPRPKVKAEAERPVLVNILTGESRIGLPGESDDNFFERLYS